MWAAGVLGEQELSAFGGRDISKPPSTQILQISSSDMNLTLSGFWYLIVCPSPTHKGGSPCHSPSHQWGVLGNPQIPRRNASSANLLGWHESVSASLDLNPLRLAQLPRGVGAPCWFPLPRAPAKVLTVPITNLPCEFNFIALGCDPGAGLQHTHPVGTS